MSNQKLDFRFFLILKQKLWIYKYSNQVHIYKHILWNILKQCVVLRTWEGKLKKFVHDSMWNQEWTQTLLCMVVNHSKLDFIGALLTAAISVAWSMSMGLCSMLFFFGLFYSVTNYIDIRKKYRRRYEAISTAWYALFIYLLQFNGIKDDTY